MVRDVHYTPGCATAAGESDRARAPTGCYVRAGAVGRSSVRVCVCTLT